MSTEILPLMGLLAVFVAGIFAVYFSLVFIAGTIHFFTRGITERRKRRAQRLLKKQEAAQAKAKDAELQKNQSLETELENLRKQLSLLKTSEEKARKELKEKEGACLLLSAREAELSQKLSSLNRQLAQLQERDDKNLFSDELKKAESEKEALAEAMAQLRIKYQVAGATMESLRKDLKDIENENEALKQEVSRVKQELGSVSKQAATANDSKQALKTTSSAAGNASDPKNDSWQAWLRRFTFNYVGERIWITKSEFNEVEEEIKKKDAIIEKYCRNVQGNTHEAA